MSWKTVKALSTCWEMNLLSKLHGVPEARGIRIRVRVSQEDLASMLNTTRQTINKELQMLAAADIIEVDYSSIVVRDVHALQACVDNEE